MDCSHSSLQVNVGSEDVDNYEEKIMNRPTTSKACFETDKTVENEEAETSDVVIIEDSGDDDDDDDYGFSGECSPTDDVIENQLVHDEGDVDQTYESQSLVNISNLQSSVNDNFQLTLLFRNHLMEPLTFVLLLHDFALELKCTKLIEDCGGVVYNSVNDIDGYTVVLVKDSSLHWAYLGAVFKVSYVQACIKSRKLLNINQYLKSFPKKKIKPNFNFMSVIYFKKYSWENIPDKYIILPDRLQGQGSSWKRNSMACVTLPDDDEADEEEEASSTSDGEKMPPPPPPPIPSKKAFTNKHTRMLYSRKEDEDILKYIVKKELYDKVKGVILWKTMETRNVCPNRTWQSMKEHFLKKIVFDLNTFKFLTEKQIHYFQVSALR